MDSPLGFTFGAPCLFQPPDLQKRKDTPPLHSSAEPTTKKGLTAFNRSHLNTWSFKATGYLEDDIISEESQEPVSDSMPWPDEPIVPNMSSHSSCRDRSIQFLLIRLPYLPKFWLVRPRLTRRPLKDLESTSIRHM
jgi:hypothetical protein